MAWGRMVTIITPVLDPHAHSDQSSSVTYEAQEGKDCEAPAAGLHVIQDNFSAYLEKVIYKTCKNSTTQPYSSQQNNHIHLRGSAGSFAFVQSWYHLTEDTMAPTRLLKVAQFFST